MVNNKVAVISGGTKGIGKAIVAAFLDKEFTVFTCSRLADNVALLLDTFSSHTQKEKIWATVANLSEKKDIISFAEFVKNKTSRVHVLVNNAGLFIPGSICAEEEGTFEFLINTNLASAYHLTRALMPLLPSHQGSHIFNICSTASITPYVNGGSYCISKFGLLGFSKVLREELKSKGIKVTSILPGPTLTDSWSGTELPPDRFMTAQDVADLVMAAFSLSPSANVEEILLRPLAGDI